MNLPTYDASVKAESSWTAIGIAVGAVAGAIMEALGVDSSVALPIVSAVAAASGAIARWLIGHFLPSSGSAN